MGQRNAALPRNGEGTRKWTPRPLSRLVFWRGLRYQPHMTKPSIDKLAKTLADTLPESLRAVRDDLEKNFKAILQAGIGKLELVSREEFDVQQAVLARTRAKLEALEVRLGELERPQPARRKAATKKKKPAGKKAKAKKPKPG